MITNCNPSGRDQGHLTSEFFCKISVNIGLLKTVQARDIYLQRYPEIYLQRKTNRKSYMAYQMAATTMTLNNLEGHSPVAGVFECNPSNICAAFYTISTDSVLTGDSALAELLV